MPDLETVVLGTFAAVGTSLFLVGTYFRVAIYQFVRRSNLVDLKVVANDQQPGPEGNLLHHPVYLVLSGPYAGSRYTSKIGYEPPLYSIGTRTRGYWEPKASEARGRKQVRIHCAAADVAMSFGLTCALFGPIVSTQPDWWLLYLLAAVCFATVIRCLVLWHEPPN